MPGNHKRAWIPQIIRLLDVLGPAIPPAKRVLLPTARGLWIPRLGQALRRHQWHPLMRVQGDVLFAPARCKRPAARKLVGGPAQPGWGAGAPSATRMCGSGHTGGDQAAAPAEPWIVRTALAPSKSE